MSTNVFVAGIFYDFKLIEVPTIMSIDNIDDADEYKSVVRNVYFNVIGSDIFKNFLRRGVVVSFGDVLEDMVVEKLLSVKLCGIFDHYCIVFSLNFHRPYIWTDSFGCRKELTNWAHVDIHPDDRSEKYGEVQKYVATFGKMIKSSTTDANK